MTSVVILDDDQETLDNLSTYLKMHDIETLGTATDGSYGLELYEKHNPDFIITDYNMPKRDGLFVIDSVKKVYPECKIIVLSGFASAEVKLQSYSSEGVTVLEKPVNNEELLALLK